MNVIVFVIFWLIGTVIALLCNERLHEYKDYDHPKFMLIGGIFLSILMSWALVLFLILNDEFELPEKIYHSCFENSYISSYEEVYLDENNNVVGPKDNWKKHETYKVYTCRICGKTWKKRLQ